MRHAKPGNVPGNAQENVMGAEIDQADALAAYRIAREPYYRAVADEVALYQAAYSVRMPMMLKGPTGCGKTRFVEYMA
jgi:nitric oxide reductase NorQ protein